MNAITITPELLRALVRSAYEDGHDDGGYGEAGGNPAWAASASKRNLDKKLAKAAANGGLLK